MHRDTINGGVGENCEFAGIAHYILETIQACTKVTTEHKYEVLCNPMNGVISNDFD